MAEKLSIKIDLSKAKPKAESKKVAKEKLDKSIAAAPPDVVYHYDRIFIALLATVGILYVVYHFVFGEHNGGNNGIEIQKPQHQVEQFRKESSDTAASTQKPTTSEPLNIPEFSHQKESSLVTDIQQAAEHSENSQQKTKPVTSTGSSASEAENVSTVNLSNLEPADTPETDLSEADISGALKTVSVPPAEPAGKTPAAENAAEISQTIEHSVITEAVDTELSTDKTSAAAPEITDIDEAPAIKSDSNMVAERSEDSAIPKNEPINSTALAEQDIEEALTSQDSPDKTQDTIAVQAETNTEINKIPAAAEILSERLSRVQLTSSVYKKEPVDKLSSIIIGSEDQATKIYLFTQLNNSKGSTIEHQWWYQGKLIISKKFTALGNRWRCYSSKNISKYRQGEWQVKIVDEKGILMAHTAFEFKI